VFVVFSFVVLFCFVVGNLVSRVPSAFAEATDGGRFAFVFVVLVTVSAAWPRFARAIDWRQGCLCIVGILVSCAAFVFSGGEGTALME
jgi:hypothetical protein